MSTTPNPFEQALRHELKRVYAKTLTLKAIAGLVSFIAGVAWVLLLVAAWQGRSGTPDVWQAVLVSRLAWGAAIALFVGVVVVPLVRMPGLAGLTRELERRRDFQDIVASGYEFAGNEAALSRYSPALVREVIRRAEESVRGLEVRFLFLERRQMAMVPVGYGALVVLLVLGLAAPGLLLDAVSAVVSPRAVAAVPSEANLHGRPGDITVLSGSDVEVSALDFGGSDAPVTIAYDLAEGFWKSEPTGVRDALIGGETMDEFVYTFRDVRKSITYRFESDERRSPDYHITVVHKPIVSELDIVLTPPAYTGEPADTLRDSGGNVQALEGTHVAVAARSNNALRSALVQFDGKEAQPVTVDGRAFAFDFQALEDGAYAIRLEDERGHRTGEPLTYSIEVYRDNAPVLDVLSPGADATLPRNMIVDLGFVASDDYGLDRADVFFRRSGDDEFKRKRIPLGEARGDREVAASYEWDVGDITLFPGNYVEYFVQVQDNNTVTGPGITRSKVFHITVPTMAELYDQVREEDANRADLLEEARREGEEFKERLEKISREFKKTEELDWTQKKEIDKAIASQESIQEKLEEIQSSLDQTMESLSDNRMTSQEIGEKLEEINRLIEEINDEALNDYIEDLREAMEQLDPEKMKEALENMELSAEDLLRSLERTESLLKEIQREQEMEELVRKTKDLMDAQEDLTEQTEATDADDSKGLEALGEEQEGLSEQAEALEKDLEKFAEGMKEDANEMSEQASEMSDQFCEGKTSETMKEASKELREPDKPSAQQLQKQAQNDMISLFRQVMEMQQNMQMSSQNRAAVNLQRLARSTLEMSFRQELLNERLREQLGTSSDDVRDLAVEQLSYVTAMTQLANELNEIANKTMAVPQQLLNMVGQILYDMQNAVAFLEQNKAFLSTTSATQAVTSLNEVTIALLSAAQQCSQGGGGSGMPRPSSGMQRLQQLLEGQRQVMRETREMLALRAAQEKLLQERQAAMQRLLGEQRSLEQLAEEIEKSTKDGDRVLGRMDRILEEMREVIRDLESGNVTDETLRKEERIVSRLLDAQRSVHTRDYEKKRLSVSGEDIYSDAVGDPAEQTPAQQLREEIRRAMSLKAPGEFEDLIKLYFRALAEDPGSQSP